MHPSPRPFRSSEETNIKTKTSITTVQGKGHQPKSYLTGNQFYEITTSNNTILLIKLVYANIRGLNT